MSVLTPFSTISTPSFYPSLISNAFPYPLRFLKSWWIWRPSNWSAPVKPHLLSLPHLHAPYTEGPDNLARTAWVLTTSLRGNVDCTHFLNTQQRFDIKVLRLSVEGLWAWRQKPINSCFPVQIRWRNTCLGAIIGRVQITRANCKGKTVIPLVDFCLSFTCEYCCLTELDALIYCITRLGSTDCLPQSA